MFCRYCLLAFQRSTCEIGKSDVLQTYCILKLTNILILLDFLSMIALNSVLFLNSSSWKELSINSVKHFFCICSLYSYPKPKEFFYQNCNWLRYVFRFRLCAIIFLCDALGLIAVKQVKNLSKHCEVVKFNYTIWHSQNSYLWYWMWHIYSVLH